MKRDPHIYVGHSPLGQGSRAKTLCGDELWDVAAIPLDVADIPVGSRLKVPDWCCRKCAKKAAELPKTTERQWLYAVTESRYQEKEA